MPEVKRIVTNTSPLIALVAALGDLKVLSALFDEVLVPFEVCEEITADNASRFGAVEFGEADWLKKQSQPLALSPFLSNALDRGEASVIQLALNESIKTVCIDEALGRRIAQQREATRQAECLFQTNLHRALRRAVRGREETDSLTGKC